jgi:gluconate 2-dehydrogenase gamma chain
MEDRRTEVTRRELLKAASVAALAAPLVVGEPLAAAAVAAAEAPKFFTRDQWALVDELAEIIIPADEHSGGARAAKVVNAIDAWLAEAFEPDPKSRWVEGLTRVDALAREKKGSAFMQLTPEDREAVVTIMASEEAKPVSVEGKFFNELKRRTSHFYYTSKIGIHDELEYKGNVLQDEYAGIDVSKEGTN